MKVFVEYNEPIGPISGFGLGDGTPGGLIIEKRVFLIFFSCGASQRHNGHHRSSTRTPRTPPNARIKGERAESVLRVPHGYAFGA